jgi:4-amino-4-deoxy-L-arabinose transferase-like glycosyltransferase
VDFLPWTPVFPIALWASARMEKSHRLFLWCWIAAIFVFFSVSSGKRGVYILPLHPASAILVGWFWDRVCVDPSWETARRWLRAARVAIAVLFAGLGIFLLVPLSPMLAQPPDLRRAGIVLGLMAMGFALAIALVAARSALSVIAGATAGLALAGIILVAPIENRRQNVVGFSEEIARRVPQGAPLGVVRDRFEDLAFYSHRDPEVQLRPGRRLDEWMSRGETVYAVLDQPAWEGLNSRPRPPWDLLAKQNLAGEDYYLIVKR